MKVGEKYRHNPLSFEPASCVVTVEYLNGRTLEYDNIHYPKKYINKLLTESKLNGEASIICKIYDTTGFTVQVNNKK